MKQLLIILLIISLPFTVSAQMGGNFGKHDSKLPVEITADNLEALQKNQKAIFTGSVVAIQGDLTLKSDSMIVFYKSRENKIGKTENSVSKVESNGNVILANTKDTANGNKAVFDVDGNMVTIYGNVVLKSGKNIVKGEKLVYDLKSGKSQIINDNNKNGKKGRVKGIFVPN